jgi:CSLREA domain-containing protein
VAVLLVCAASARADITVNATGDAADSTPDNGLCESTLGCTLRAAVQTAEGAGNPGPDVIHLGVGTYDVTLGTLNITTPMTLVGAGVRTTIIRSDGTARLFTILMSTHGDPLSFSDLTLTGARGDDGGALRSNFAQLSLTRVAVVGNETTGEQGGGVFVPIGAVTIVRQRADRQPRPYRGRGPCDRYQRVGHSHERHRQRQRGVRSDDHRRRRTGAAG